MGRKIVQQIALCSVLQVLLLISFGQQVSSQDKPSLGIFGVQFQIVLTIQSSTDSITTAAIATQSPSSAKTASQTTSSASPIATSSLVTSPSVTSSSVTSSPSLLVTTQSPSVTNNISAELYFMLSATFAPTIGYLSTTKPTITENTGTLLTYRYDVIYDKTRLNEAFMFTNDSAFIKQVRNVSDVISAWGRNFTAQFTVDAARTRNRMTERIQTLSEQFAAQSWLCSGSICPNNGTRCRLNGTASILTCVDKCQAFELESSCTREPSVHGVYIQGTCALDTVSGNPYCNCGRSVGDVMSNFYDGEHCVSVTFVVAMAASAGGLFFILWLITLCIVVCDRNRSRGSRSSSTDFPPNFNGYHEGYHNMELGNRPLGKENSSQENPKSSHTNNAYDVTKENDEEFKSIRL